MKTHFLQFRFQILITFVLFLALTILYSVSRAQPNKANQTLGEKPTISINLDKALKLNLPPLQAELKATPFQTTDGKDGWALQIPGSHPIATPAYYNGMIFVGGGYASHEFYAFDAKTGKVRWQIKTSDDGPSAAVVEDGCVAFNTESCTVIVVAADTGKLLWQEWLGDPLMSQPAISNGRLFIAYPAGQRGNKASSKLPPDGHRLLCADLKTGRHIWEQAITADVISAPVVEGNQLFFTCFDGTSFCLSNSDGSVVWKKQNFGTSAPIIVDGQLLMTSKENRGGEEFEGLMRMEAQEGKAKDKQLLVARKADYLEAKNGGGVAMSAASQLSLDSSVGFSGNAPAAANLTAAAKNVGIATVAGGWAFQGSRASVSRGQVLNAQGRFINSIAAKNGAENWRAEITGSGISAGEQVFSPPSLGSSNMYLCGLQGYLLSLRQDDGKVNFAYKLEHQITFQPALAEGNIYFGTVDGILVCLKTNAKDADGWYAWGGNAQHNKKW
jgi:Ca-activated chloride channel homolog